MNALRRLGIAVGFVLLGAACGGPTKAYVPVDSPLKEWEAPEEEDLGEPTDEDEGDEGDSEEETEETDAASSAAVAGPRR